MIISRLWGGSLISALLKYVLDELTWVVYERGGLTARGRIFFDTDKKLWAKYTLTIVIKKDQTFLLIQYAYSFWPCMCRGYFLHSTVHWPNDNQACRRLQAAHRIDLEWIACAGAEVYIILGDGPLHTHLFYIDTLNFSSSDKRIDFDWKKWFLAVFFHELTVLSPNFGIS